MTQKIDESTLRCKILRFKVGSSFCTSYDCDDHDVLFYQSDWASRRDLNFSRSFRVSSVSSQQNIQEFFVSFFRPVFIPTQSYFILKSISVCLSSLTSVLPLFVLNLLTSPQLTTIKWRRLASYDYVR